MTNLIEVAEELEFVPKESLIEFAQDPNSRFPSYMVLSEIQRRTQMEKMYNAARMERPQTTVAQELVGEFSQPQGLAGAMTDDLGRLPNNFSDSVAPANSLMQMANGGLTGSDAIREAERRIEQESILDRLAQDRSERQTFGEFASGIGDFFSPEGQPSIDEIRRSNLESTDRFLGGSETEDNILERAGSALKNRYFDDEGDFNYGTAATDALLAVPGGFGLRGGIALLSRLNQARKAAQAGAKAGTTGATKARTITDRLIRNQQGGLSGIKLGGGALAAGLYGKSLLDDETKPTTQSIVDPNAGGVFLGGGDAGSGGAGEGGKGKGDDAKKKEGLLGKIDPLDIAKLGGIILGAKGTGDIGQGITALASDVQQRRTAQQERLADEAYRQLQGDYLKSQKQMLDINIANAPTTLLLSKYEALNKAYKQITEQAGNSAEAQEIAIAIKLLSDELTGRAANTNTGQESLEGLGATLTQGG